MEKLTEWIRAERGRLSELSIACKVTHSAVWQWTRVPAERVLIVERVTGIPRQELRPDLYGEITEPAE